VLEFLEICLVLSTIALFSKGVLNVTLLPIADGARLLGIHPKTLHHWLKEANMPLVTHPRDARIKCVTDEHLQQVANLHGRPLQSSLPLDAASPLAPSQGQAPCVPENEREPASTVCSLPTFHVSEADQVQRLACLETKVVTLQEQITQLTLVLLKERERSVEHRLTALEALLQQLTGEQMPDPPVLEAEQKPVYAPRGTRPLRPAEQLARSRRPALIEYCASGIYVISSSQEGEVHLEPNSRAWFDWLATLSSFRFIGPVGRGTRPSRIQTGPPDALLVGLPLCSPSYLQALSWRNRELDSCEPRARRGQTPI
jgi:hypothetical protein